MASRAAATTASVAGVWVVRSPTVTTSMRAASDCSTVAAVSCSWSASPGVGLLAVEPGAEAAFLGAGQAQHGVGVGVLALDQ
jgi:hypothetical protein